MSLDELVVVIKSPYAPFIRNVYRRLDRWGMLLCDKGLLRVIGCNSNADRGRWYKGCLLKLYCSSHGKGSLYGKE